ncbi:MAG TPA: hypothetical protein PKC24_12195, partial [Cyclobacteriaceae bacterium]|nr:hypothetical protein [Cyclobacteriaceae bacterium]
ISGGNTISLNIADNDNDPLNEIQDLSLSGNTLTITGKANPNPINLSTYLDNTDNQNLSLGAISGTNRTINISNGASVTFSVADNDNSSTNEAQTLTRTGSLIILSQVSGVGGGNFFLNDMQGATISNVGYPFSPSDAATKQYVDERLVILSPIAQMSANADGISTTHSPSTFAFKVGTSFNGSASNSRVNLVRSLTGFDEAGQINQNRFSAQQDGIYQFTINASSTDPNATLKVSINGAVVSEVMKINTGVFQENLFFKLNTNDYLEFLIDQNSNGNLTGTFFGFKL